MNCPKCGGHIGRLELSANCKHCGVNLFYCQQETLLSRDAKRCELEMASFRILSAKLKTAFVKWPLPLLKMLFTIASIAVLAIPFATIQITLPLFENTVSFWAYGLYQMFDSGTLAALFDMLKIEALAPAAIAVLAELASMVLVLLAGIALFAAEVLSFLNIQKHTRRMVPLSIICMAASAAAIACPFVLSAKLGAQAAGLVTIRPGAGPWAALGIFTAVLVVSILTVRKNIQPAIKEVDLQRVEMNKRVRKGEVSLDDLPLPVFETEQEREERMKIIQQAEEEERANAEP